MTSQQVGCSQNLANLENTEKSEEITLKTLSKFSNLHEKRYCSFELIKIYLTWDSPSPPNFYGIKRI